MQRKVGFFLAFFWAAAVQADPPSLTVPSQITGSPGAFLSVPAVTSGKTVKWLALDSGLSVFPSSQQKDSRTAVVLSLNPGSYRLVAMTAAGDELSEPAVCVVTIQATAPTPAPAPAPGPAPAPSPAPQPQEKASWAVVVVDNTARTPALGQLLGSPLLFSSLKQAGVTMRVVDVHDPVVQQNGYSDAIASAGGAPALIVYTEQGRRLRACRLPSDEASVLAAIGIATPLHMPRQCGPGGCPANP